MDPKMDSGYVEPDDPFEPEYQAGIEEPSAAEVRCAMLTCNERLCWAESGHAETIECEANFVRRFGSWTN